jgi:DNA replication ATP-dependent helicase Dna2
LQNDVEANLIYQATETLLRCGISQEQLAVVSVYRSQLRLISQILKSRQGIEIATIDKYQGRDKECVMLSLVRNNTQGNVSL